MIVPAGRHHLFEPIDLRWPFWQYGELASRSRYAFLLDSGADPHKLGRYSFLGLGPVSVFKAWRNPGTQTAKIQVFDPRSADQVLVLQQADPFHELQLLLDSYRVNLPEMPVPFVGGAVGVFGYEANYFIEDLPDLARDDLHLPTMQFALYDAVLAYAHETDQAYLSIIGRGDSESAARRDAVQQRDAYFKRLAAFEPTPVGQAFQPAKADWKVCPTSHVDASRRSAQPRITSHFDEAQYGRLVDKAKEHIFAGDVFEVCLTHRLECDFAGDSWRLYQELRRINPAPFACYLRFPDADVVCSSPERFVRLGRDRIAESRPIKGTRRRGQTPAEDERLHHELLNSPKDRAENIMIVDLVRNDFGRVCKFHTIHVPELTIVEKYATVFQLVSTIRGELEDGVTPLQLVQACFPGGSMTGAPKIEAMKIIDRLEPVKRGIYSGSIGYLDYSGAMDLNIVIRTLIVKDGRCYFNVGGAIVADSQPRDEHQETMVKAAALTRALASST